jgi:hypothetical protein
LCLLHLRVVKLSNEGNPSMVCNMLRCASVNWPDRPVLPLTIKWQDSYSSIRPVSQPVPNEHHGLYHGLYSTELKNVYAPQADMYSHVCAIKAWSMCATIRVNQRRRQKRLSSLQNCDSPKQSEALMVQNNIWPVMGGGQNAES